jgi:hypothetical protein
MDYKQKVLDYIRLNGPSLPMRVAKTLGLDTIIASAYLAELVSQKKVYVSNLKVGGSPVYYLPNTEHLLEKFSDHLNAKEKEAFFFLKSQRVTKDSDLTPQLRVAMGFIKDFAKPIVVEAPDGTEEKYWKWFSLKNEEVSQIIKQKYYPIKQEEERKEQLLEKIKQEPTNQITKDTKSKDNSLNEQIKIIKEKSDDEENNEVKEIKKIAKDTSKKEIEHEQQKTLIDKSEDKKTKDANNTQKTQSISEEELTPQPKKIKKNKKNQEIDLSQFKNIDFSTLPKEIESELKTGKIILLAQPFEQKIKDTLTQKGFDLEIGFQDKKGKEIIGFTRLTSAKKIRFFMTFLKTKRVSDKDLGLAFLKSSSYSLPLLILYSGNLTKGAQEILSKTNIESIKI